MTDTTISIAEALPDYEVQRELGRGAMGVVYLGRHRRLDRVVAIKEISGPLADDPDVRSRFLTEARILAALEHPHIVPVYDYVEDGRRCLLIMEALGGGTVWDRFQRDGLTLPTACSLLLSTCAAVEHAHRNGILHRDLKPENLLLSTSGHLKVADFGIAKVLDGGRTLATVDGSVLGTPAYMAPEQAEGGDVGPPADVYALGVMLYEMLCGRLPHEGESPMAMLVARISNDAPPLAAMAPGVPAAICTVVDRAVARSVGDRISSASELARELHRAAIDSLGADWLDDGDPTVGGPSVAPPTLGPAAQRQPAPATIAPSNAQSEPTESPEPDESTESTESTQPAETTTPSTAPVAPSEPSADVVHPAAASHPVGFDANLRRDELVKIEVVVRPTVPFRLPAIATVVLAAVTAILIVLGPADPATSGDGLDTLAINGQTGSVDLFPVLDATEPIVLTGLAPDATEVTFDAITAGLSLASATAPVNGGGTEVDLGPRGWIVGGVTEGRVVTRGPGGDTSATVIVAGDRPWWQSGIGAGAVLIGLFALAGAESQSRRHRRGTVRTGSAIAAAAGAGVAAGCGTVILALTTDRVVTLGGWVAPAVMAAAAAISLTVTRARLARRRRIRWRERS